MNYHNMTKQQLINQLAIYEVKIKALQGQIENLNTAIDGFNDIEKNGVRLNQTDWERYQILGEHNAALHNDLQDLKTLNSDLIKTISAMNGGVMKDLSESLVNLTRKKQ